MALASGNHRVAKSTCSHKLEFEANKRGRGNERDSQDAPLRRKGGKSQLDNEESEYDNKGVSTLVPAARRASYHDLLKVYNSGGAVVKKTTPRLVAAMRTSREGPTTNRSKAHLVFDIEEKVVELPFLPQVHVPTDRSTGSLPPRRGDRRDTSEGEAGISVSRNPGRGVDAHITGDSRPRMMSAEHEYEGEKDPSLLVRIIDDEEQRREQMLPGQLQEGEEFQVELQVVQMEIVTGAGSLNRKHSQIQGGLISRSSGVSAFSPGRRQKNTEARQSKHKKANSKSGGILHAPLETVLRSPRRVRKQNENLKQGQEPVFTKQFLRQLHSGGKTQTIVSSEAPPAEEAKPQKSKAAREKQVLKQNIYIREREILRDWVRRTLYQEPVEGHNYSPEVIKNKYHNLIQASIEQAPSDTKASFVKGASVKANEDVSDLLVFQFNARDKFFKLAAERKAKREGLWVQNSIASSYFYRVKWDYSDSHFDYSKQMPHQLFNHFPDTRELTTKQGLNKNLNSITQPGTDVSDFYPRCYDLSNPRQLDLFMTDFNQTSVLNILQKHARYFERMVEQQPQSIRDKLNLLLDRAARTETVNFDTFQKQKLVKRELSRLQLESVSEDLFGSINLTLLQQTLYYCQNLLNQTVGMDQMCAPYHTDEFFKRNCFLPEYKLTDGQLETLYLYSQISLPLRRKEMEKQGLAKLRRHRGWTPVLNVGQSESFQLDLYLVYVTLKMHRQMEKHWPQYKTVNGSNNVWICKPCYNSRGLGIYCFNQKSEIIHTFAKKAPTPKVVQKYIERPLLLRGIGAGSEELRKFDIRQWVLVTSIEPLKVYIYKDAYLRICGQHYDIEHFHDPLRHLSNYSLQKKEAAAEEQGEEDLLQHEFVMGTEQLVKKLNSKEYPEFQGQDISWSKTFFCQIQDITKKVFQRMAEVMEHSSGSFELFGLDFVIDEALKCWLIEANMSPACAHRKGQQWLDQMVEDMADGLLNIVEHKLLVNMMGQKIDYNGPVVSKINQLKSGTFNLDLKNWQLIDFETENPRTHHATPSKTESSPSRATKRILLQEKKQPLHLFSGNVDHLEVRGKAIDIKYEKKMHRRYLKQLAALFIQRVYRGHMARRTLRENEAHDLIGLRRAAAVHKLVSILQGKELGKYQDPNLQQQASGFLQLKQNYWRELISRNEASMLRVILIQRRLRTSLLDKQSKTLTNWNRPEEKSASLSVAKYKKLLPSQVQKNREDEEESVLYLSNQPNRNRLPAHRSHKRHRSRTRHIDGGQAALIDPNLLLNYWAVGVEISIPTSGRRFHMQGGMKLARSTSENPVEQRQAVLLQRELAAADVSEHSQLLVTQSKFSPYMKAPTGLQKKSVYDIYSEGASKVQAELGFKFKKEKLGANPVLKRDPSPTQTGFGTSDKKTTRAQFTSGPVTKDKQSASKHFSNRALAQRINSNMAIDKPFIQRLNNASREEGKQSPRHYDRGLYGSQENQRSVKQHSNKVPSNFWHTNEQTRKDPSSASPYLLPQTFMTGKRRDTADIHPSRSRTNESRDILLDAADMRLEENQMGAPETPVKPVKDFKSVPQQEHLDGSITRGLSSVASNTPGKSKRLPLEPNNSHSYQQGQVRTRDVFFQQRSAMQSKAQLGQRKVVAVSRDNLQGNIGVSVESRGNHPSQVDITRPRPGVSLFGKVINQLPNFAKKCSQTFAGEVNEKMYETVLRKDPKFVQDTSIIESSEAKKGPEVQAQLNSRKTGNLQLLNHLYKKRSAATRGQIRKQLHQPGVRSKEKEIANLYVLSMLKK